VLVKKKWGEKLEKETKGGKEKSKSKSKSRYKNVECYYCIKLSTFKNIILRGKGE